MSLFKFLKIRHVSYHVVNLIYQTRHIHHILNVVTFLCFYVLKHGHSQGVFGAGEESNLRTRLVVRKNRGGLVTWEVGVAKDQHETWRNYVIGISVFVVVGSPSETWTRTRNIPKVLLRGEGKFSITKGKIVNVCEVSKPLIEKRRRARINRSLSQLVEMVAKPSKVQENRTARFEKAYILEMTVEYVKKLRDQNIFPEKTSYDDYENSFQEGYRLCMAEIQNFFKKSLDKKTSEELLMKSLLKYLCKRLKAPSTNSEETVSDVQLNPITSLHSSKAHQVFPEHKSDYSERIIHTQNNVSVLPGPYKSQCPSVDSCSSTSLQSIEDEGNYSISEESESSSSEEKVFYGPENYGRNETFNKDAYDKVQNNNSPMWRPW
ncbi:BHLH domain-containing protein [Caerostris darwini]|uniref:BHLH domain-containing protein n=1 Tax=Caerostris darwini TaxID=1538125 RepID=A0AAV4S0X4_9ARAC|nr:BHLH domain-containing protein [Caerostris darwini]